MKYRVNSFDTWAGVRHTVVDEAGAVVRDFGFGPIALLRARVWVRVHRS